MKAAESACPAAWARSRSASLLDKIIGGDGTLDDLDKLEKLCVTVQKTSLCGLGQSAPNPVVSTLKYFRHEYEALVQAEPAPERSAR